MALDATDWSISRSDGNIRYIGDDHNGGSPGYVTALELHRWLQDLADDASSSGDDELDITDENPTDKKFETIIELLGNYNIDDTAAEHIFGGSIIQEGGDVIYDAIINYGNAAVQIQIAQNGAVLADDWWNYNSAGLNPDSTKGVSHRFLIKVRDAGADIDDRKLIGTCRRFLYTYSEFKINGTSRGENTLALSDTLDLNNETIEGTVSGWTTIANLTEGYAEIDVTADGNDEPYYSEWNRDSYSINQFYERMKWLTRDGSTSTIYGLNGELFRGITHEIPIDGISAQDWDETFEAVTWTGGAGQLLAINDANAPDKMWIQLLTGSAPTDGQTITGTTSTATADVNGTPTERPISAPFCGASTGSALISAYGFTLETADLTKNDKMKDLDSVTNTPPNLVTFTVGGMVDSEDRILVAPWDGTSTDGEGNPAIEKDQMATNAGYTGAAVTSLVMTASIPTDTPSSGGIRVELASGKYAEINYSSYTGSTFTITSTDFSGDNVPSGADVWVAYVDEIASGTTASFQSLYGSDRSLVVVCRDGGGTPIKQFISSATLGSTGGSVTVIRTSDA